MTKFKLKKRNRIRACTANQIIEKALHCFGFDPALEHENWRARIAPFGKLKKNSWSVILIKANKIWVAFFDRGGWLLKITPRRF